MKKSTANKLNMYLNVNAVLNNYQSTWEPVPVFVASVSNFSTKLSLLQERLIQQDSATKGVSANKNFRITDLRERMMVMHKALKLYGKATGNWALAERNNWSRTGLIRLNISKLTVHCGELKQDLDAFGPQLMPYGISSDMILEITPMLETINEVNISTRQAILGRKSVTQSISDLQRSIDNLLQEELDELLLVFKTTQAAFFEAFRNARIIIRYNKKGKVGGAPEPDDGESNSQFI